MAYHPVCSPGFFWHLHLRSYEGRDSNAAILNYGRTSVSNTDGSFTMAMSNSFLRPKQKSHSCRCYCIRDISVVCTLGDSIESTQNNFM